MSKHTIRVSIITITGNDQLVKNGFLDAIISQTMVDQIELIVIGINTQFPIPEIYAKNLEITTVWLGSESDNLCAQLKGIEMARGEVVAFIEDHCIAQNDWARRVYDACTQGSDAVAYAMKNGSPDTYMYRSIFLAEYGLFAHPMQTRELTVCPDGNGAYNKDKLISVLKNINTAQPVAALPWHLEKARLKTTLNAQAVVSHKSFTRISDLFKVHYILSRVFARHRVIGGHWGLGRRLVYAVAVPLALPHLQIIRLFKAMGWKHPQIKNLILSLPLVFALHLVAAMGEGMGYIFKDEYLMQNLMEIELSAVRR